MVFGEYDFECADCGCRLLIGWDKDRYRTFICPKCNPMPIVKSHPLFESMKVK